MVRGRLDVHERKHGEANLGLFSQDLASLTDIDATMNALGAKVAAHMELSAVTFAELIDSAQIGVINYGWHRSDMPSLLGTYRMDEFVAPEILPMCQAGKSVVIDNVFRIRTSCENRLFATSHIAEGETA